MKYETLGSLKNFSHLLSVLKLDVFKSKQISEIQEIVNEFEQICNQEVPTILWIDNRGKIEKPKDSSCNLLFRQYSKQDNDFFPPLHHQWIFCCSNIESFAASTASTLTWLKRAGQKGKIFVYGTDDPIQKKKVDSSLSKMIDKDVVVYFSTKAEMVEALLPEKYEWKTLLNSTPDLFLKSFVDIYSKEIEFFQDKIGKANQSVSRIFNTVQSKVNNLEPKINKFTMTRIQLIDLLSDELPDFSWIEAMLSIIPGLDFDDSSNEEDNDEIENGDDETLNNLIKLTKSDFDKATGAFEKEAKRAIIESLDTISLRYVTKKEISFIENDSILKSALQSVATLLDKPLIVLDLLSANYPEWPLNLETKIEIIDRVLKNNPIPSSIFIKIINLIAKAPVGNNLKLVAVPAINILLDKWGEKVYKGVINEIAVSLEDFEIQYKQWLDIIICRLNEKIPVLKEYAKELEYWEEVCFTLKRLRYNNK